MSQPRILVVTSCTGEKRFKPENQLVLEDFKDSTRLQKRENQLVNFACQAGQIYTGAQHLQVMEGVGLLRQSFGQEAVDLRILSAGYGLIREDKNIVPYEVTFNTMKRSEVDEWAKFLKIHSMFEKAIAGYNLVFVLLGDKYLRSLSLPVETSLDQTLVFLASKTSATYIRDLVAQTFILPLSNVQAKQYSYGLVGLKGFLFKQFSKKVVRHPELLEKIYQNPKQVEEVFSTNYIQL